MNHRILAGVTVLAAIAALSSGVALAADASQGADPALVARGRAVATAADCVACHTAPGGKPFAGGLALHTPLGTIYSTNITPSMTQGIGHYDEAGFARAVREGVTPGGKHLYPAMPYPSYSAMTDADIHALYAYFREGVAPQDVASPKTDLGFPFNIRASMAVWNMLYLSHERFAPHEGETPQLARGRYLTQALEHCGTCHTPRGLLMGPKGDKALGGAQIGAWVAPNVTPDKVSGIGTWPADALAQYLKTGVAPHRAQAAGPMAEVIEHSTQHLPDEDIAAMVAYLRQVTPVQGAAAHPRDSYGSAGSAQEARERGLTKNVDPGWKLFSGVCGTCHQPAGAGRDQYPALFHNTVTGADIPDNLVATILFGVRRTGDGNAHYMPGFGDSAAWTDHLSDAEVATVANYVFRQYGNPALHVTTQDVTTLREGGASQAGTIRGVIIAAIAVVGVVLIGLIVLIARRKKA